jgi:integrase
LLRALRERQEVDSIIQGYLVNEDSSVFRYRDGRPILPRTLTSAFAKIMDKAGMAGYRLHDARHSHASLLIQMGIHDKVISERLGHSSIGITMDLYGHITPPIQDAAALRFEEGLARLIQPKDVLDSVAD